MQITKTVSKRSRELKQTNAMEEIGKVCQGIRPRWLYGQILSNFQEIDYPITI